MTSLSSGLKTVSQSANVRRGANKLLWKRRSRGRGLWGSGDHTEHRVSTQGWEIGARAEPIHVIKG